MLLLTRLLILLSAAFLLFSGETVALTLADLEKDQSLTPHKLASHFASFKFEFRAQVQPPDEFLLRGAGDCDDFATLAAHLLKSRGYNPKLIAVRMPGEVHVVCYVPELRGFLDYNARAHANPLIVAEDSIEDIATKVAASFGAPWRSASEFTFERGVKRMVQTHWNPSHQAIARSDKARPSFVKKLLALKLLGKP